MEISFQILTQINNNKGLTPCGFPILDQNLIKMLNLSPLWFLTILDKKLINLLNLSLVICSSFDRNSIKMLDLATPPCDFYQFLTKIRKKMLVTFSCFDCHSIKMLNPCDFSHFWPKFYKNAELTPRDFFQFWPKYDKNAEVTPCDFYQFLNEIW